MKRNQLLGSTSSIMMSNKPETFVQKQTFFQFLKTEHTPFPIGDTRHRLFLLQKKLFQFFPQNDSSLLRNCSNLTILLNFSCDIKIGSFVDVKKEEVDLFSHEDSAEKLYKYKFNHCKICFYLLVP